MIKWAVTAKRFTHAVTEATLDAYLHDRDAELECECGFRGDEEEMADHVTEAIEAGQVVR